MLHTPVLLKEVIEYLKPEPGKKFIDATLGAGGHTAALLAKGAEVLGIDRDPEAVSRIKNHASGIRVVQGNFGDLKEIAKAENFTPVDGVLLDLGLGSHQLDEGVRGFAFQKEGPLDMRFDQTTGKTAGELINYRPEKELIEVFRNFGEERRFGRRIARAILDIRKTKNLENTAELFELIKSVLPGKLRYRAGDTARRIFQALRIAVNQELTNLEKALPQALDILKFQGRLVVISFHSLEDRIAKRFFVENAKDCVCPPEFPICVCEARAKVRILTRKPVIASETETKNNPRAHSAKLRAAEKIYE